MGVHGLTTVINSKGVGTDVPDIAQLPGKLFVVDGYGMLYSLVRARQFWRAGTCYNVLFPIFKAFLERFLEKEIALVVFLDGSNPETKSETAKQRFLERSSDSNDLALYVINGTYDYFSVLPSSLYLRSIFKHTLKELKQSYGDLLKYELCYGEADPVIAKYAADNNVRATGVFANDSDFYVFSNIKYFPLRSLSFKEDGSISGTFYSAESIAASLSIELWQYQLAVLYMGTDHCPSVSNSGTPLENFEHAVRITSCLKEDEKEQYFTKYWGNTEGCYASLQFYNHESSWELKDLAPAEAQSPELLRIVGQLIERDVSYLVSESLLFGTTFLISTASKFATNVRLFEKTRPIRVQIYQLFYHYLDHYEYTIKEKIANKKNNLVYNSIVLTESASTQKSDIIQLLTDVKELPREIKWKNVEDSGFYFEDISSLTEVQRRIITGQFIFADLLDKVNLVNWWFMSKSYRDSWFLSTLIVVDQINPLKDWELELFVAIHFQARKAVNNFKSVPQKLKSDVERCNTLCNLFEVAMYNVGIVNDILEIPVPNKPCFEELNACFFYEMYLKAAASNVSIARLMKISDEQMVRVTRFISEFKSCAERTQPAPPKPAKKSGNKPKTAAPIKTSSGVSLANKFGSLALD